MAYDEPLHGGFCRVEPRSHPPDAKIFRDISEGKSFDDPWTPYTLSWKDACQLVWSSEPELNGTTRSLVLHICVRAWLSRHCEQEL